MVLVSGVSRCLWLLCALLLHVVQAYDNLTEVFWQLGNLEGDRPKGNPWLGGQNQTYCCLLAVNQSLAIGSDGDLVIVNTKWIVPNNVTAFLDANDRGQFPCGASYNGDPQGAPIVQVPYQWLNLECPGWQMSGQTNLNAWLQPLSGFLVPAVIFCLSVPRRRKVHIFRGFFVADLSGLKSYVPAFFGAVGALLMVTLDTIIWLSTCFAFSGPMILSGLYEALLDNRILDLLRVKIHHQRLTLDMRCRCLMVILIGNLDLALDEPSSEEQTSLPPPKSNDEELVDRQSLTAVISEDAITPTTDRPLSEIHLQSLASQPLHGPRAIRNRQTDTTSSIDVGSLAATNLDPGKHWISRSFTSDTMQSTRPETQRGTSHLRPSPWRHMEELLYGLRLYDDADTCRRLSPRQFPGHTCNNGPQCRDDDHVESPRTRTLKTERQVKKTKTRLRAMLHCQYSFGSIVGAPVIFFLGGFVFALLQSLEGLGDEDIAEGLAFGQWYMTIPHIAIVSGLLLAGNNPNILEGLRFELAYPSCYKTAWQWLRGHTKKRWISKVVETYSTEGQVHSSGDIGEHREIMDMVDLQRVSTLSPLDWVFVLSLTMLLLGVPYVLAFLTAYYTPEVGLSCRSLSFTLYISLEFAQIMLWLWAFAGPQPAVSESKGKSNLLGCLRRDGWLDRRGFFEPTSTAWLLKPRRTRSVRSAWMSLKEQPFRGMFCITWYLCAILFGFLAIFVALGGTLMQLMGVYSANVCAVTTAEWFLPLEKRSMVGLSSNSQESIILAQQFWVNCAISAISFMSIVSFVGWWYQRRMRDTFGNLVEQIDLPKYDRYDAAAARPVFSAAPPPNIAFLQKSVRDDFYGQGAGHV